MSLIKTIDKLNEVINIDSFINNILPSIIEISLNKLWRIRIQIIENIPILAKIIVIYYIFII